MGSEARARLAFAGVLLVTLLSFGELFAGNQHVGPSLLAAAGATGLAMLFRRLGAGPWLTLWASAGALGWYLCIVFQSPHLLYGLPTPRAAAGIAASIGRALEVAPVDFAPVPARPGYVMMTVIGIWTCAALGEVATFRWRRPLLAGIGPISLFALLMIIGDGTRATDLVVVFICALLAYWAFESTHRLRSWGRWVSPWATREPEPEIITGRVARRMGAAAVGAALVAPLIVPALGSGLLSWRTPVAGGPSDGVAGGGTGGSVNPLVRMSAQLIEQTDAELFRVTAEESSYWRLVSLTDFDGDTWTQPNPSVEPLEGSEVGGERPGGLDLNLDQSFELTGLEGRYAPAAEKPVAVGDGADRLSAEVETQHLEASDGNVSGLSYEVRSATSQLDYDQLRTAPTGDPGEAYFRLPPGFDPRIEAIARRWVSQANAATDFEKLVALQDRFHGSGEFIYSETVEGDTDGDDYLHTFLTQTRAGYCQQYATSFAVMARTLGYPARVSVGFLPGNPDPDAANTYIVRGTHAHAWPEVYFSDYGWVRFEPTPRDLSPPLSYTRDAAASGAPTVPLDSRLSFERDSQDGRPLGLNAQCAPGTSAAECEASRSDLGPPLEEDLSWQERFAVIWRTTLGALALFLLLVPAVKELRIRRRYRDAATPSEATAAAFSQFIEDAAELAAPRAPAESALAYAARLAAQGRVAESQAGRLARLYERSEYSARGSTADEAAESRRLAQMLRRLMWRRASWWMRLSRLFSPAPLFRPEAGRTLRARLRPRLAR